MIHVALRFVTFTTQRLSHIHKLRAVSLVLLTLVSLWILPERGSRSQASSRSVADSREAMPTLQGEQAIEHLKQQGTYASLGEAMAAIKYQANWQPKPKLDNFGAAYEFKNAANNLLAYVNDEGLQVTSLSGEKKSWRLGLQLKAYGYGDNLMAVSAGEVKANQTRVEIKRNSVLSPHGMVR